MELASYITGFVDGEGCFSVSFSRREKMKLGVEVRPSFSVSQHQRNRDVIISLKNFFDCGAIRYSKKDQNYKYEVRSIHDLVSKVIPHFDSYPLQTTKARDYQAFCKICQIIHAHKHASVSGMRRVIQLAVTMNEAGKRRYTSQQLLSMIGKMKV